jgi:hypothetical protein
MRVVSAAADVERGIAVLSDWLLERGAAEWTAITDKGLASVRANERLLIARL